MYTWEFKPAGQSRNVNRSIQNDHLVLCDIVQGNTVIATARNADHAQKIVDALNKADAS
jgi:hypothetical protein